MKSVSLSPHPQKDPNKSCTLFCLQEESLCVLPLLVLVQFTIGKTTMKPPQQ